METYVKDLIKESSGIRSISRVLKISTTTVSVILRRIASKIEKPSIKLNKVYEVDELKTHVQRKKNEQWIIYAIDKKTRQVVDFRIGKRNKGNIRTVVETLLLAKAKRIYTDKLNIYPSLIPKQQHKSVPHNTNYIERKNLDLRTHLKCLARRSICFSRSVIMLMTIIKIYFWA
jgi:insertion element IS1 protein InsB